MALTAHDREIVAAVRRGDTSAVPFGAAGDLEWMLHFSNPGPADRAALEVATGRQTEGDEQRSVECADLPGSREFDRRYGHQSDNSEAEARRFWQAFAEQKGGT